MCLQPALDGHEVDVGGRGGQPRPGRLAHEPGLDRDPARPERSDELGPADIEVAVDVLDPGVGCLAGSLDRVPAVGEHDDLIGADEKLTGDTGDLLFAVPEADPGQVAGVLGAHAEVTVDSFGRHPLAKPSEAARSSLAVGLVPPG